MKKVWKSEQNGSWSFYQNEKKLAELVYAPGKSSNITMSEKQYQISQKGFWKSRILIKDKDSSPIIELVTGKWYGASYQFSYNGKEYSIEVRNNPLTQWVILFNGKETCSYSLKANSSEPGLSLEITGENETPLFDCLLWYLFLPIAIENGVNQTDLELLLLLSS